MPIFGEESYDALEREGWRSGGSSSVGGKLWPGREGDRTEAGRNTQLCFGEDEETQAGRDRARHGCVLVRMKKHKVKTTGYCGGTKEEEDIGVLLRA